MLPNAVDAYSYSVKPWGFSMPNVPRGTKADCDIRAYSEFVAMPEPSGED